MPEAPTSPTPEGPATSGDVIREQDKIMLVLAYLGIFSLIPLLTVKDSEYVKWHAKQGLALLICWFVGCLFYIIPIIGWVIGCFVNLAFLILMVMAIVKAFGPQRWKIPVVSAIAEKF